MIDAIMTITITSALILGGAAYMCFYIASGVSEK